MKETRGIMATPTDYGELVVFALQLASDSMDERKNRAEIAQVYAQLAVANRLNHLIEIIVAVGDFTIGDTVSGMEE